MKNGRRKAYDAQPLVSQLDDIGLLFVFGYDPLVFRGNRHSHKLVRAKLRERSVLVLVIRAKDNFAQLEKISYPILQRRRKEDEAAGAANQKWHCKSEN